jgi:hypothetical protein
LGEIFREAEINDLENRRLNLCLDVPLTFIFGWVDADLWPATPAEGVRETMSRDFALSPEMKVDEPFVREVNALAFDQLAELLIPGNVSGYDGLKVSGLHAVRRFTPPNMY